MKFFQGLHRKFPMKFPTKIAHPWEERIQKGSEMEKALQDLSISFQIVKIENWSILGEMCPLLAFCACNCAWIFWSTATSGAWAHTAFSRWKNDVDLGRDASWKTCVMRGMTRPRQSLPEVGQCSLMINLKAAIFLFFSFCLTFIMLWNIMSTSVISSSCRAQRPSTFL